MFSKEMPKIIRSFYRNIINKGKENGEIIRLGSNSYNIKNYKVYKWSYCNSNFPTFYSGGCIVVIPHLFIKKIDKLLD